MPNVLIRDVPAEDLEELRAAAVAAGEPLQARLLAAVRSQAVYLRRQAALAHIAERLTDQAAVPERERAAVLGSIAANHAARADQLAHATEADGSADK